MNFLAEFHPHIVHFPIAFFILYAILEILGIIFKNKFLNKAAFVLLAAGVFTAVLAVLTGNQADEGARELLKNGYKFSEQTLEEHETYATISLWFFTGILFLKIYVTIKKLQETGIKYLFIILALLGSFFIYETAAHGGEMVYKYGIGTEAVEKQYRIE